MDRTDHGRAQTPDPTPVPAPAPEPTPAPEPVIVERGSGISVVWPQDGGAR
ncbi:hypothetical protein ACGF07_35315 [Kitasatospora sp. NPDC048194]|uniref:hypothetical protein n=1 Tax=Kitasatospora sp. NPDC048194 TaxID=3364045 RepID=UPI00371A4B41